MLCSMEDNSLSIFAPSRNSSKDNFPSAFLSTRSNISFAISATHSSSFSLPDNFSIAVSMSSNSSLLHKK